MDNPFGLGSGGTGYVDSTGYYNYPENYTENHLPPSSQSSIGQVITNPYVLVVAVIAIIVTIIIIKSRHGR